jgi:hypothetical protein
MATFALVIRARLIICDRCMVHMEVVTKMLGSGPAFMLAIAGHRSPGNLERKPNQQKDTDQAAHGEEV